MHVDTNSHKLKVDQKSFKVFGWARSKMGAASLVIGFQNWLSQEWIDGINWYFACWYKFRKPRNYFNDVVVKSGHGHVVYETLKSAVSYEWVYELSWFFACWLWCINFWLDWHLTLYLWLLNASLLQLYLLDPGGSWNGLLKWSLEWSVHPSIFLSVRVFYWNWIITFLWILA